VRDGDQFQFACDGGDGGGGPWDLPFTLTVGPWCRRGYRAVRRELRRGDGAEPAFRMVHRTGQRDLGSWATNAGTGIRAAGNQHLANVAYFNSFSASAGAQTRLYRTSGVAISAGLTSVSLKFYMYHDSGYPADNDNIQPQVSVDGGTPGRLWIGDRAVFHDQRVGAAHGKYEQLIGQADVRLAFLEQASTGTTATLIRSR